MPNYLTAKNVAERSLRTIGAVPPSQVQANAEDLTVALQWLEMFLNFNGAKRIIAGTFKVLDIPLEAGVGDYDLTDYTDSDHAMHVFSVGVVDAQGNYTPLTMLYENQAVEENLKNIGTPERVVVSKDRLPQLKIYPEPTTENETNGLVLRVRLQSYAKAIDARGIADNDLLLRPGWYLWAVKGLAYEIGCGPVRRLNEYELDRFQKDVKEMESNLLSKDGQNDTGQPPATEPWEM